MSGDDFNFEKALEDLNKIVSTMEQGGLSLEECLSHFEEGIALTRKCQQALQAAEQKIRILLEKNGELSLQPFNVEPSS